MCVCSVTSITSNFYSAVRVRQSLPNWHMTMSAMKYRDEQWHHCYEFEAACPLSVVERQQLCISSNILLSIYSPYVSQKNGNSVGARLLTVLSGGGPFKSRCHDGHYLGLVVDGYQPSALDDGIVIDQTLNHRDWGKAVPMIYLQSC